MCEIGEESVYADMVDVANSLSCLETTTQVALHQATDQYAKRSSRCVSRLHLVLISRPNHGSSIAPIARTRPSRTQGRVQVLSARSFNQESQRRTLRCSLAVKIGTMLSFSVWALVQLVVRSSESWNTLETTASI